MHKLRYVGLAFGLLAILGLLIGLSPTAAAQASLPLGITLTPTSVTPTVVTPTDPPPGPTATPTSIIFPPGGTPSPTPDPPRPQRTRLPEVLPDTGELPPGSNGPGGANPLVMLAAGILLGLGIGAGARRWLSASGLKGLGIFLFLLAFIMIAWTARPSQAVAGQVYEPSASVALQVESPQAVVRGDGLAGSWQHYRADPPPAVAQPAIDLTNETDAASAASVKAFPASPEEPGETQDVSSIRRIVIPALGLDSAVVYIPLGEDGTWDISTLRTNLAWLGATSSPGAGGNTVIAGHVTVRQAGNGPFYFLHKLAQGDIVEVYTRQNIYTYQVRQKFVVKAKDVYITDPTTEPQITLLTCTGWDYEVEDYTRRWVVVADLVSTTPIQPDLFANPLIAP